MSRETKATVWWVLWRVSKWAVKKAWFFGLCRGLYYPCDVYIYIICIYIHTKITMSHYKDPYEPTSIIQCNTGSVPLLKITSGDHGELETSRSHDHTIHQVINDMIAAGVQPSNYSVPWERWWCQLNLKSLLDTSQPLIVKNVKSFFFKSNLTTWGSPVCFLKILFWGERLDEVVDTFIWCQVTVLAHHIINANNE